MLPIIAIGVDIRQIFREQEEFERGGWREKCGIKGRRILRGGFFGMGVLFLLVWIWFFTEGWRCNIFNLKESVK